MVALNHPRAAQCPQCQTPVPVQVEQIFDVGTDPTSKQRLLSGQANSLNCPNCGFRTTLGTPIVYHDASKELLLTFVPMEMGLPPAEKERTLGALIRQVIDRLPSEQRKAYILRPQEMLTYNGLMERILEADGVTKEMLAAQQAKVDFVRRLLQAPSPESATQLIQENDEKVDQSVFQMIMNAAQSLAARGDENGVQKLVAIQELLLAHSTFGQAAEAEAAPIRQAQADLEALGESLTREKIVDLLEKADNQEYVAQLVSMVRPAFDYPFFDLLSARIDTLSGESAARLTAYRDLILEITKEMDSAAREEEEKLAMLIEGMARADNIDEAVEQTMPWINEELLSYLQYQIAMAKQQDHKDAEQALLRVYGAIMKKVRASAPPEVQFVQDLLELPDEDSARRAIRNRVHEVTPQLVEVMNALSDQMRENGSTEVAERIQKYREIAEKELALAKWR
jgi:hypothetical protein